MSTFIVLAQGCVLYDQPADTSPQPGEIGRFDHPPTDAEVAALPGYQGAQLLDALKAERDDALSAAAREQILGGFQSGALGTPHLYPSDETSQRNLLGSVTDSLLPDTAGNWTTPFWAADAATGQWAFRDHTAAQIQQVGRDGKALVVAAQTRLAGLRAELSAASTVEEINAITW